jgi:hypothetical protein
LIYVDDIGILLKRKIEMRLAIEIKYSEIPIHKLEHQMSSSSASARAPTSYTYGVPGSQVTLNLNKSGNHSVILSRGSSSVPVAGTRKFQDGWVGPANTPFCKVCYDAGLSVADYTDHFVKDQPGPDGKVVCPTLLAQKCLSCGVPGHTTNYCPEKLRGERERSGRDREEREQAKKSVAAGKSWETVGQKGTSSSSSSVNPRPRIEDMVVNTKPKPKSATASAVDVAAPRKTYGGSFGLLSVDDSSSDNESEQAEIQSMSAGVPKPVIAQRPILTGPPPAVEPAKPLTWAQRAAAAAQKPSTSSSRPASAVTPLTDTRFHLHALCERVEQSKRAPKRQSAPIAAAAAAAATPTPGSETSATAATTTNHRAAAATVAAESSRKRKQNSAMVPA